MKILDMIQGFGTAVAEKAAENSPEILIAVGVVGIIGSVVMACRASREVETPIEEAEIALNDIKEEVEEAKKENKVVEDAGKRSAEAYKTVVIKVVKAFAPVAITLAMSIGCILYSHKIMKDRNLATAAAFTVVANGFKEYRERVKAELGAEADHRFRYGVTDHEIVETKCDENGQVLYEETKKEPVLLDSNCSIYAHYFDRNSHHWNKYSMSVNREFIVGRMDHWNYILKARKNGIVFLNEVLKDLDLPLSPDGQIVGWCYDPEATDGRDNCINIDMFEIGRLNPEEKDGVERVLLLDFNVDGNVLRHLSRKAV